MSENQTNKIFSLILNYKHNHHIFEAAKEVNPFEPVQNFLITPEREIYAFDEQPLFNKIKDTCIFDCQLIGDVVSVISTERMCFCRDIDFEEEFNTSDIVSLFSYLNKCGMNKIYSEDFRYDYSVEKGGIILIVFNKKKYTLEKFKELFDGVKNLHKLLKE